MNTKLFSPLGLNLNIVNRFAVAPMTTSQSNADGTVSDSDFKWLERLASDNYGLIITCAAAISKSSIAFQNQMNVGDDTKLVGLSQLAEKLSHYKSKTVVQLCHGGSRTLPELTGSPAYSASKYEMPQIPNFESPLELSKSQISEIIDDFVAACVRVEKAGFHGVEFHGANGYLFTQFFSKMSNIRADEFGGCLENRARFAREVVQECRKKVSSNFIIGFRITFENMGFESGLDIDENIKICNWLAEDGIDYLHVSSMVYNVKSGKYPEKVALQYIRENVNQQIPIIGVGSIFNVEDANMAMEYGADIVAFGRAAIGNEKIPSWFENGEELPNKMPYNEAELLRLDVSDDFISIMKNTDHLKRLNVVKNN